jgi:hypothetical protein
MSPQQSHSFLNKMLRANRDLFRVAEVKRPNAKHRKVKNRSNIRCPLQLSYGRFSIRYGNRTPNVFVAGSESGAASTRFCSGDP